MANQTIMTGPKNMPTIPVPRCWMKNKPVRISTVAGTTNGVSDGATISSPSIAESTEMAGVIMLSP